MTGLDRGFSLRDLRETGEALDAQFYHIWSLSNGKITKFQLYAYAAKLQQATGS